MNGKLNNMDRAEGILVWMDKEFYYVPAIHRHLCSHCGKIDEVDVGDLLMDITEEV